MGTEQKSTASSIDDAVGKVLLDALENGVTALDDEGKPIKLTPSPAMITAAIKYVQSKGGADPAVINTPAGDLQERMRKHPRLVGSNPEILKTPIEDLDDRATA